MEETVYEWAKTQISQGRRVQMVDLCRLAKSVSSNPIFQGSSGWCANFLNRHPDIKQIVKNKKIRNTVIPREGRSFMAPSSISQKLSGRVIYPDEVGYENM